MRKSLALAVIALLAGCASSSPSSDAPPLDLKLVQVGTPAADMYYFSGPINVQYDLVAHNPANAEYTLKRLDIQSVGPGAYSIRTGSSPITYRIPPNTTTTIHLSTWARAAGGFLRAEEPVTVRAIAQFDGPKGTFQKVWTETLSQFR
jgi:hypothetical protein